MEEIDLEIGTVRDVAGKPEKPVSKERLINIVAQIGTPEITGELKNLPVIFLTMDALDDMLHILGLAETLAEKRAHESGVMRTDEIGYYFLGDQYLFAKKKTVLIVERVVPVPPRENDTNRFEKGFNANTAAEVNNQAAALDLEVIMRGHDHHEVGATYPSQRDLREIFPQEMLSAVDCISRRSRDPVSIAFIHHEYNEENQLELNNIGGFYILGETDRDLKSEHMIQWATRMAYVIDDKDTALVWRTNDKGDFYQERVRVNDLPLREGFAGRVRSRHDEVDFSISKDDLAGSAPSDAPVDPSSIEGFISLDKTGGIDVDIKFVD